MGDVIRVHGSVGFVAAIPELLGGTPRESIVAIALRRGRSCGALRMDLSEEPAACEAVAAIVTGTLCRIRDADAVALAVYSGRVLGAVGSRPGERLVRAVAACAVRAGFALAGCWCVAADGWDEYAQGVPGGRRLAELARTHGSAGRDGTGRGGTGYEDATPGDPAEHRRRSDLFRAALQQCSRPSAEAGSAGCGTPQARSAFLEAVLHGEVPDTPQTLARVLCTITPARFRDAALLQIAFGPEVGEYAARAHPDPQTAAFIADLVCGQSPVRPDPWRMRRGRALLGAVTGLAQPQRCAPAYSMMAWLCWAEGRGSDADRHAGRALECEPGYRLARLLRAMIRSGRLPQWLFEACAGP